MLLDLVSATVGGVSKSITSSVSDGNITFDIPSDDEKKPIVIEYKTKLTNDEIINLINGTHGTGQLYKNEANINRDNKTLTYHPTPVTSHVQPTGPQTNPIQKSFVSLNPATKKATWRILVNAYGIIPNPFKITDSVPESGYLSDIDNVKIDNKTPSAGLVIDSDGKSFTLDLYAAISAANGQINPNGNGQYEITYETTVSDAAFGKSEAEINTNTLNTANLTDFNTYTGTKTATAVINPGSLSGSLIRKEYNSQNIDPDDPQAWLMAFFVHVNENRLPVGFPNEVTVTDTLPDNIAYEIKSVSVVTDETTATVGEITYGDNNKSFTTSISNISGNYAKLEVKVKITDRTIFNKSQSTNVNNKVELKHGEDTPQTSTARGTLSIGSANVKIVDGYDPDKKEITWRVAVNQSSTNIALGKVTIVDTIPAGLEFVSAEYAPARADKSPAPVGSRNAIKDDSSYDTDGISQKVVGNQVTWELNVSQARRYDIWVKTRVLFDSAFYNKETNTTFTNTATVTTDNVNFDSISASITVPPQKILEKNGEFEANTNKLNFTVGVNPLNQKITTKQEILFTDKLSENLFLLKDTVKVYEATVAIAGDVHDKGNTNIGEYSYTKVGEAIDNVVVEYDRAVNTLGITLPVPENDDRTYLIEYSALATASGDINNNISISEIDNVITNVSSNTNKKFKMSASGYAYKIPPEDQYSTLEIKKVKKDGNPIEFTLANGDPDNTKAAQFDVFDSKDGDNKLCTTTPANPIALIIIDKAKLTGLDSVWVQETKSPEGYIDNPGRIEVSIKDFDKMLEIKNYHSEEEKKDPVSLTVIKQDENGTYQTAFNDAKFALFTDVSCSDASMVAGSEKNMTSTGITYDNLIDGHVYYLKETVVPSGYQAEIHEVHAGTNTTVTVTNRKLAELKIFKETETGAFLAGAKVTIYKNHDKTVIATDEHGVELKDIELVEGGVTIHLGDGTYWVSETTVPEGYDAAPDKEVEIPTDTPIIIINKKTPPKPPTPPTPDNPGDNPGGDTPGQPPQITPKTDANGVIVVPNGTIIHTGQLWWPVWVMGVLGAIFVIAGIIMAIVKRKRNYPED